MEQILREGFKTLGVAAPPEAAALLRRYYELLSERNKVMNLTAITGEAEVARLHFLDCGALLRFFDLSGRTVADVGSGAGFPGLVLKILCPDMRLVMLDGQQKRVAFQQEVVSALGLEDVMCVHARAEDEFEGRGDFDLVVSRAVARLDMLSELCIPLLRVGGVFVAMKGPDPAAEVSQAHRAVRLLGGGGIRTDKYTIPDTDVTHSLVTVKKTGPTPVKYPRHFSSIKKHPL